MVLLLRLFVSVSHFNPRLTYPLVTSVEFVHYILLSMYLITLCFLHSDSKTDNAGVIEGRPAWMKTLHTSSSEWLAMLPTALSPLKRTVENIKDPLYR